MDVIGMFFRKIICESIHLDLVRLEPCLNDRVVSNYIINTKNKIVADALDLPSFPCLVSPHLPLPVCAFSHFF